MRKDTVLTFLISVIIAALIIVNGVFIHSYVKASEIQENGLVFDAKVIEVIQRAEGGRRLSQYNFQTASGVVEYSLKARLKLNQKVRLIVSPAYDARAFKVKDEGSWLQVYNGLTGGLIITLALMFSHLGVLIITTRVFIAVFKVVRTKLTKRST